jgi:hypothetical protein
MQFHSISGSIIIANTLQFLQISFDLKIVFLNSVLKYRVQKHELTNLRTKKNYFANVFIPKVLEGLIRAQFAKARQLVPLS